MTRLSMNELTTFRWSFEEDLLHYCEAGYDGIGVWLRKLRDFGEERAVELVAESGLRVSSVAWEGGFTGADARTSTENLAAARDTLALCGELRAGCLVVHSGSRNGHTRRHADRLLRTALDELLPHAEASGTPLALEPMHPACAEGWTFLTSVESALRLAREYDTPALRIAFDTYHFPLAERDWPLLAELAPYIAIAHVGDISAPHDVDQARLPLGEGDAPLAGILGVLNEAGYGGFYDVKLTGPAVESADYHGLLRDSHRRLEALGASALPQPIGNGLGTCNATW